MSYPKVALPDIRPAIASPRTTTNPPENKQPTLCAWLLPG